MHNTFWGRLRLSARAARLTIALLTLFLAVQEAHANGLGPTNLELIVPGDHTLRLLTPKLLELVLVNSKQPDPAHVDSWDWVDDQQVFTPPALSNITVRVNGQAIPVAGVGFKRRPLYAPLQYW